MKLYKYLPISPRSLSILESGKIYYPKPEKFNDPFDCGLDLCEDITIEEKIAVLGAVMRKQGWPEEKITKELQDSITPQGNLNDKAENNIKKLTQDVHGKRDNFGVLSLSGTCEDILMWTHYANEHKGMCIEFEVAEDERLFRVSYATDVPRCTLPDLHVERDADSAKILFATKHKDWQHEEEYRLIWSDGNRPYDIPGPITAIIFGLRTTPEDKALVRNVATGLNGVRLSECEREPGKFGVKIVDC